MAWPVICILYSTGTDLCACRLIESMCTAAMITQLLSCLLFLIVLAPCRPHLVVHAGDHCLHQDPWWPVEGEPA